MWTFSVIGFNLRHFRQVLFSYFHFETLFSQKKVQSQISKSSWKRRRLFEAVFLNCFKVNSQIKQNIPTMKRVSSCIFVRRKWYGDVILFPFPLHSQWKASKDEFFPPFFLFHKREKIRFCFCCKKHEFCFWIFFLSSYKLFLSHSGHLHSIVNFYKTFHLHPRNIVLPYIADTFKKYPKWLWKTLPFEVCILI